jgi:hypothetical protein
MHNVDCRSALSMHLLLCTAAPRTPPRCSPDLHFPVLLAFSSLCWIAPSVFLHATALKTPLENHNSPFPSRTSERNLAPKLTRASSLLTFIQKLLARVCFFRYPYDTYERGHCGIESAMFQNIASRSDSHSHSDRARILLDTRMHLQSRPLQSNIARPRVIA